MAVFGPLRYASGPEVNILRIYVENHYNECREFFIWITFDNIQICEKASLPLLREDPLISETCPLEENASHHICPGQRAGQSHVRRFHSWAEAHSVAALRVII